MMQLSEITTYQSYRIYMSDWLASQAKGGHGLKSKLAEFLHCRPSYLSKIMQNQADLSPEQSLKVTKFFGLNKFESKFFRLLVDIERASSSDLKDALKVEMKELLLTNEKKKSSMSVNSEEIAFEEQKLYYSAWHTAAVHMALTQEKYKTAEKIANNLRLPLQRVNEAIRVLVKLGLVRYENDQYLVTDKNIHLDINSVFATHQLINWRNKAIEELPFRNSETTHFSAIASINKKDANIIRTILINAIKEALKTVQKTEDEDQLYAINIDWFKLDDV